MTSVSSINSTQAGSAGNVKNSNSADALSQRFMDLLIAQIKNQDPLNPMDGQAMTGQLTQMNSLSQLEKIASLLENQQTTSNVSQLSQAAASIGKKALVNLDESGGVGAGVGQIYYDFGATKPFMAKLTATDPNSGQILGEWNINNAQTAGSIETGLLPKGALLRVQASYANGQPDNNLSGSSMLYQAVNVKQTLLSGNQVYLSDGNGTQLPWNQVRGLINE